MNVKLGEREKLNQSVRKRSTIGLKASTKKRLDRYRAPGQCYDGFIQQMVDHWEKSNMPSTH
ncbi:MAG: hypothetical protein JW954_00655 [Dehalococcoidaceae bacterium]|nr:hypothetical protein [Dehalococcoidaceae bacterium]